MTQEVEIEKANDRCPECGYDIIVNSPETGENICAKCGLVVREATFDNGPEWRAFTPEEWTDRSRAGSPETLLHADKGLSTVIQDVNKDAYGHRVSLTTSTSMLRLKKYQYRIQFKSSMERNLPQALLELDRIADKLHIGHDLQEEAAKIYRGALEKELVRGRSISAMMAACVYTACRKNGRPRSFNEIASVSRVRLKFITKCYRTLLQEISVRMPIPDPVSYVSRIASKANVSEHAQVHARALLKKAEDAKVITGKDPIGLAAAALYVACLLQGEKKTQKEIADAGPVTEVTLRKRAKSLSDFWDRKISAPTPQPWLASQPCKDISLNEVLIVESTSSHGYLRTRPTFLVNAKNRLSRGR